MRFIQLVSQRASVAVEELMEVRSRLRAKGFDPFFDEINFGNYWCRVFGKFS